MYLFRLDAAQKAARLLALAVTNAYIAGLHRQETFNAIPVFRSQMLCRVWWVIYMVDRRMALESGRPFLVQDGNVQTALPLPLSDDWMSRYISRPETASRIHRDIATGIECEGHSGITYMERMIQFYRIVGRAWPILHSVEPLSGESVTTVDGVDAAVWSLLNNAPKSLSFKPNVPWDEQFREPMSSKAKRPFTFYLVSHQHIFAPGRAYICTAALIPSTQFCTSLRLLVKMSRLPGPSSLFGTNRIMGCEELKLISSCAELAGDILLAHDNVTDPVIKYSYSGIHHVISAAMIMTSLLTRRPSLKTRYGPLLLRAIQHTNIFCYKAWVSGKMMRTVSKLSVIVRSLVSDVPRTDADDQRLKGDRSGAEAAHREQSIARPKTIAIDHGLQSTWHYERVEPPQMTGYVGFPVSSMADFEFESDMMSGGHMSEAYANTTQGSRSTDSHGSVEGDIVGFSDYSTGREPGGLSFFGSLVQDGGLCFDSI